MVFLLPLELSQNTQVSTGFPAQSLSIGALPHYTVNLRFTYSPFLIFREGSISLERNFDGPLILGGFPFNSTKFSVLLRSGFETLNHFLWTCFHLFAWVRALSNLLNPKKGVFFLSGSGDDYQSLFKIFGLFLWAICLFMHPSQALKNDAFPFNIGNLLLHLECNTADRRFLLKVIQLIATFSWR